MGVCKIMARSLNTIKAQLKTDHPTLKSDGRVFDEEEYNETINAWADEIRANEIDQETNGYKYVRKETYPEIAEQLDLLYHDMTAGKGDKTGEWYKAVKAVKDANPKP